MTTRSHLLAYSIGSTLGLIVGTLAGGPVVDHLLARQHAKRKR